jgi:hypothetical protein
MAPKSNVSAIAQLTRERRANRRLRSLIEQVEAELLMLRREQHLQLARMAQMQVELDTLKSAGRLRKA